MFCPLSKRPHSYQMRIDTIFWVFVGPGSLTRILKDISNFEGGSDPHTHLNPSPYLWGDVLTWPDTLSSMYRVSRTHTASATHTPHTALFTTFALHRPQFLHIIKQGRRIRHEVSFICRRCAAGCRPCVKRTGTHHGTCSASRYGAHRTIVAYYLPPLLQSPVEVRVLAIRNDGICSHLLFAPQDCSEMLTTIYATYYPAPAGTVCQRLINSSLTETDPALCPASNATIACFNVRPLLSTHS